MVIDTQTNLDRPAPTALQFGHPLCLPVDAADAWPDLRGRNANGEELDALRLKITQLFETVENLDKQLAHEEADRHADPAWFERADRPCYIPGSMVSFIHISLKFAQRMLAERRDDEAAVAHLRLAEGPVRQVTSWRTGLVEELLSVVGEEPATAVSSGGGYTPPRFFILEPVK